MAGAMIRLSAAFGQYPALLPALAMNPFSDWLTDTANSISDSLMNARVEIVKQLAKNSLPTVDQLASNWYLFGASGAYGLARGLSLLVALIFAAYFVLTPNRNHSVRIGRTWQSVVFVAFFGLAFFPLYSIGYQISQNLSQMMIDFGTGQQNASLTQAIDSVVNMLLPQDAWLKVIVAFVAMLLAWFSAGTAMLNVIIVLILGFTYIIIVALRPLGDMFDKLFHLANSGVITTMCTPAIITFGLMLPNMAVKANIPFISSMANTSFGLSITVILGSLISTFGPIGLAYLLYNKSQDVFGNVTSSVSGAVDINSMPPLNEQEANQSVRQSGLKAFASTMGAGALGADLANSDDMTGDLKRIAMEGIGVAAGVTGHPWVAAAISTVDTTTSKEKRKHVNQMPPPAGQPAAMPPSQAPPPPPSVPSPPPSAPIKSPINEWPNRK